MKGWLESLRETAAAPGNSGGRSVAFGALVAVLAAGLGAAPAAGQFAVQPVIVELRPGPGGAVEVIGVLNESDEPLQLRIYGSDYDQPAEGGHVFMELGAHERSCADRLEFFPDNLVLEPRGAGEIRIRMEPGSETCWSLVFVQSVSRAATGIRVAQRIGVKVYGIPTQAVTAGEIREVTVVSDGGSGRRVELAFANMGGAPVRPQGEVEIRSEAGEVVGVVPVQPFSVLPGRVARTTVALDVALGPGTYVLVPILDFGGDYLAGGQALLRIESP